jgi:hypothetical protein
LNYNLDYIKTIFKEVLNSFQPQNIINQVKIGKEKFVNEDNEEITVEDDNNNLINKENVDILTNLISNGFSLATGGKYDKYTGILKTGKIKFLKKLKKNKR